MPSRTHKYYKPVDKKKTCKKCGTQYIRGERKDQRCPVCRKNWSIEYRKTLKYQTYQTGFNQWYQRSERKRLVHKKYRQSEKGRRTMRRKQKEFSQTERGREYIKKYQKEYHKKYKFSDAYLSKLMRRMGIEPTKEILEAYKLSIQIKRKIYEIEREIKPCGNYARPDNVLQGLNPDRSWPSKHAADN